MADGRKAHRDAEEPDERDQSRPNDRIEWHESVFRLASWQVPRRQTPNAGVQSSMTCH